MPVYHKPLPTHSPGVRCSVCQRGTCNPRQLPCEHTFCQSCFRQQLSRLSTILETARESTVTIECPDCSDYFFSSLPMPNERTYRHRRDRVPSTRRPQTSLGHYTEYSAPHSKEGNNQRCQPCAEGDIYELASFWCQNCSEYFCSVCARYHQAMRMSKDHIVKTIKDKERYGSIKAKVHSTRPMSARAAKPSETAAASQPYHYYCEPCSLGSKTRDASFLCDSCKEQMCEECARCHRNMKMAKTHKMLPVKEVLKSINDNSSLSVKCDRHYGEVLSLYCKRCKTSCCSICAMTTHSNCGKATKLHPTEPHASKQIDTHVSQTQPSQSYTWGEVAKDISNGKSVSFSIKPTKATDVKPKYAKMKMELRKTRIELESNNPKDWVTSIARLTTGDVLVIQLYEPILKMLSPRGELLSSCRFYGDPWSVAVYNDSLAVVSFSDRKQLQLINITRLGLENGKKFSTRHKCMAVCFAKNLIAASCWEGCIHIMDVTGKEIACADLDHRGDRLFHNAEYIASNRDGSMLFVSDYKRNSVTALSILPSRVVNKPVFVFKHKELQGPKGIAVDREGFIYVSGMSSRNIFRLASSGELVQVFRRREDTEYYEAIAVSPDADRLLVSAYEENALLEFKLKQT